VGKHILITGGAGFIGSHLADELLRQGHRVRALDNLSPQVHGLEGNRPEYLDPAIELQVGDVRNPDDVRKALDGVDQVVHFAAAVGVGQSMYEIAGYTEINNMGTAVLLEALVERPVERLLVASSMSIYGEGLYRGAAGIVEGTERPKEQLQRKDWELRGPEGETLEPVPTPETKSPSLASVYALSKYDQERLCLMIGRAYDMPTVAMRFFNVFGTRQALSNPYTGVLAIFASRYLNDRPPLIFEDGRQNRDFVSVTDVARACALALESERAAGEVFNIGSGRRYDVLEVARLTARALGKESLEPEVTGQYRVGDIRHCFADITKAKEILGFTPETPLEDGIEELAEWVKRQTAADHIDTMRKELASRGLAL
jgi:dTDP-L-rhamnose 4-epimerase